MVSRTLPTCISATLLTMILSVGGVTACGSDDPAEDDGGSGGDPVAAFLGTYSIVGVAPNNCYNGTIPGEIVEGTGEDRINLIISEVVTITLVADVTSSTSFVIDQEASPAEMPGLFAGSGSRSGNVVTVSYDNSQGFLCDSSWTKQ
jgi:hypothetical protein